MALKHLRSGCPVEDGYDALTSDDVAVDEKTETVECHPTGWAPVASVDDPRQHHTTTVMDAGGCFACDCHKDCPVKKMGDDYGLRHTRGSVGWRAGGASGNSGLKRKTGMGRLRIRSRPKGTMAVLLRCAGWNLFGALSALQKRRRAAFGACCAIFLAFLYRLSRSERARITLVATLRPYLRPLQSPKPPSRSIQAQLLKEASVKIFFAYSCAF